VPQGWLAFCSGRNLEIAVSEAQKDPTAEIFPSSVLSGTTDR